MNRKYVIERYKHRDGNIPFTQWMKNMKRRDPIVFMRILSRIDRAEGGNFGDYRYLRDGVWEMKIDSGPGYRVYFAVEHRKILLLLIGGDKKSQNGDIRQAISFWVDHQSKEKKDE